MPPETCQRGHPRTQENTYVQPSNGRRTCRVCRRLREGNKLTKDPKLAIRAQRTRLRREARGAPEFIPKWELLGNLPG